MTETYTLQMQGQRAGPAGDNRLVQLPDSFAQGLGSTIKGLAGSTGKSVTPTGQPYGNLKYQAWKGDHVLCKRSDGQQIYMKVDAERSDPARGLIYLIPEN